ncbi:hypothetical protein F5887DRAFT_1172372 [Amanita rubescens]|nr:hypothetical protein F5887DRAFT_1172372 [Amanita rubescens]
MRTFGAIFATLTLAISASAAAIYPRDTAVNNLGGLAAITTTVTDVLGKVTLAKQDVKSRQLPAVAPGSVTDVLSKLPVGSALGNTGGIVPRGVQGVPDVINGVIVQLEPIIVKIDAQITATVAVELLTQIKVIICDAIVSINAIVKVGGSDQLLLDGKVVTVVELGALIAKLIVLVIPCLKIVVTLSCLVAPILLLQFVALGVIVQVAIEIGVDVSACITAAISANVIADLDVNVFATLRALLLIK